MTYGKRMANKLPTTAPFEWLLRSATKLQKSCYRNAGFKYRITIRDLKNEIERLTKRGEEIIPALQEEIEQLKNQLWAKEKLCNELQAEIEDIKFAAEERDLIGHDANIESSIVTTVQSKDSNEPNEDAEKEKEPKKEREKEKDTELEESEKETKVAKGTKRDLTEYARQVELEMSRVSVPKKKKKEKEKKRPLSFSPHRQTPKVHP